MGAVYQNQNVRKRFDPFQLTFDDAILQSYWFLAVNILTESIQRLNEELIFAFELIVVELVASLR